MNDGRWYAPTLVPGLHDREAGWAQRLEGWGLARRGPESATSAKLSSAAGPGRSAVPLWRGRVTGLTTDLLNPKAGVFCLATIPQFMTACVSARQPWASCSPLSAVCAA